MKRRDFLKGITAIGAISAAPKLIASEAERQLADSKILHNGPVRGIISKGDLTEESLGQLLDEIGDEPIAYNWSEVVVSEPIDLQSVLITGIDENGNRCAEIVQIDVDFVATTKNVYKSFELIDPTEGVKNITVRMAGSL